MTDEEMAEKYVDTILNKDNPELDEFVIKSLEGLNLTAKQAGVLLGITKGVGIISYLAGLKAGRPKWHKVADGDLPKHENYVLVSNGKDWTKGFYKDKKWNIIHFVGFTKIIMWKEIELPKEEIK